MKVNFDTPLKGLDGRAVTNGETTLMLGAVCAQALNVPKEGQRAQAAQRGRLAMKVVAGGTLDVTPEEAALIRADLPDAWAPIIVAQAHGMLEG